MDSFTDFAHIGPFWGPVVMGEETFPVYPVIPILVTETP